MVSRNPGETLMDFYYGMIFFGLLVGSILQHELGHAWGALIQRVPVRRVMLYGGGGYCQVNRSVSNYEDELFTAIGPIVNLTLWALASMAAPYAGNGDFGWALETLAWINLFLAVFNLMPVLPLDGGRLFRLLMLRVCSLSVATRISGAAGLAISVAWLPLMAASYYFYGLVLLFIPPIALHWHLVRHGA